MMSILAVDTDTDFLFTDHEKIEKKHVREEREQYYSGKTFGLLRLTCDGMKALSEPWLVEGGFARGASSLW